MRQVIGGDGSDTTTAVLAWLAANNQLKLQNLVLIGNPGDPLAWYLTDYESPLIWSPYGLFHPAKLNRGTVTSKFGLDVQSLTINWTPDVNTRSIGITVATANPWQLALQGYYDNWPVRVWTVYMPTPGDANTFGASPLFGGRVAKVSTGRDGLVFTVNSYMDTMNEMVPANVIELLNTLAAFTGAVPPHGFSDIPQFNAETGSSTTEINGDCTNIGPHQIFGTNDFQGGFLVFNSGPGATLAGVFSAVQVNIEVTIGGHNYNQFNLYAPLPWPPTPGVDTFFVSGPGPLNAADGDYFGFPFVPAPETI